MGRTSETPASCSECCLLARLVALYSLNMTSPSLCMYRAHGPATSAAMFFVSRRQ